MVCHSFKLLILLATAPFLLQVLASPVISHTRGICATEDPDESFLNALDRVQDGESQSNHTGTEARKAPITIDTWFHIVSSEANEDQVTDDMINSQVSRQ